MTIKFGNVVNGLLTVTSLNGYDVINADVYQTNTHLFETSELPSGVYVVSFTSNEGEKVISKLIITH